MKYLQQQIALLRLLIYQERNALTLSELKFYRSEVDRQWRFVNRLHIQAEGVEFVFTDENYPPIVVC